MASDEDARAAARRIVEEVLASREGAAGPAAVTADTSDPTDAAPADADRRAGELVDDAVDELVEDDAVAVPEPQVSEARARARELVAEVLAAHDAAHAPVPGPDDSAAAPEPAPPADHGSAAAHPEEASTPAVTTDPEPGEVADEVAPESTARLRARELVAATLAEAEARDAAAAAEAEEARRAEQEAAAAREREQEAARLLAEALAEEEARAAEEQARAAAEQAEREAREREQRERDARAIAEEPERELWAAADRDAASETLRMTRQDEQATADPDDTTPLSVAELAAASRAVDDEDTPGDPPADTAVLPVTADADATAAVPVVTDADDQDSPENPDATVAMPVVTGAGPSTDESTHPGPGPQPVRDRTEAIAVVEPPSRDTRSGVPEAAQTPSPDAAERSVSSGTVSGSSVPVLEATVDLDDVGGGRRTGRWLLASVLGAITLAILFPLAINALLRLVSLS